MNGYYHQCTGFDLGDGFGSERILSILPHIDVSRQLCSTTFIDNVCINFSLSDDSGILLAGADSCAVSRDGGVDWMLISNNTI
jgi:hypothetical protein